MKKWLIFSMLYLGICVKSIAQIDTEFWFAAPDLEAAHAEQPIWFSITSFENAATVVFEQPANPSYNPMTFHLNANDFHIYNVSDIINIVETKPYNTILNYGFHIYSTAPVSVYYESANLNSEIYSLKGSNALGNSFVVPMQYTYSNYSYGSYSTCSRIEIVATEDSTTIIFIPSKPLKGGGLPGVPINIMLNRGQTYAIEANSPDGTGHLCNTWITSDKPIAVNTSDDSVWTGGLSWDLVGDQIVPVTLLGQDYLALWNNTPNEYLYFFPIQNDTKVYLNGNQIPIATLNQGQQYEYQLNTPIEYIHSDKPISVFQLASDEIGELGGTVLPHINCTGSRKVVYKRNGTMDIIITLVVKSSCVNDFLLNGNANCLTSSDFNVVPSYNEYSYCKKDVSQYISTNGLVTIENTNVEGYFQIGIFSKGSGSGTCSYGYFSNYHEYAYGDFNMDDTYCTGDDITFEFVSEGITEPSLLQPDGSIITQPPFVLENVQSTQSGRYYLQGIACDDNQVLDYIDILIDTSDTTEINVNTCGSYSWNGTTYDSPGYYEQLFSNHTGCDSLVRLSLAFYEQYDLVMDSVSCDSIQWINQTISESGLYSNHFISANGCDSIVNLNLTINHSDTMSFNVSACENYTWNEQTYTSSGIYTYITTNEFGCNRTEILNLDITSSSVFIQGKTSVYPSTDITSGIYQYNIDFTGINPANVHWSIDREDWLLFPNGASCNLLCTSAGRGVLHAWTEGEFCDVDTTLIINAAFYGTEENETQSVSIYPNPTNGSVTVSWQDIVAVKVFNMMGQMIKEYMFEEQDKCVLNMSGCEDGIYIMEIVSPNKTIHKQLVLANY